MQRLFYCSVVLSVLVACDGGAVIVDDGGTQIGQEASCAHFEVSRHTKDEVTPLGISAEDFFSAHAQYSATLDWADGGTASVDVNLEYDGELSLEDDDIVYEESSDADCPPRLRADARVTLVTDDGALDELFQGEVRVYATDDAYFNGDRYGDTLQGDVDLDRFASIGELRNAIVYLFLAWSESGAEGEIVVNPQNESGSGSSSPLHDVAHW